MLLTLSKLMFTFVVLKQSNHYNMKTQLPTEIKTIKDAEQFLTELSKNGESFHPEDDAHDIIWSGETPSTSECDQLNKLMDDIYQLEDFDPCGFLLENVA